jgi:transcriptional regulator with XRE-family HTH domain
MHKNGGTLMCTLYERIQELCKAKGVSASRMCLDLGLSKSTMSDIKNGRKKGVSTGTAQKIASYFNVSVGYLLGKEEKENALGELILTKDEIRILQAFRGMSPEKRKALALFLGEDDPQK